MPSTAAAESKHPGHTIWQKAYHVQFYNKKEKEKKKKSLRDNCVCATTAFNALIIIVIQEARCCIHFSCNHGQSQTKHYSHIETGTADCGLHQSNIVSVRKEH